MGKIKTTSLRSIFLKYGFLLIMFILVVFFIAVQLDKMFQKLEIYHTENDNGVAAIFLILTIFVVISLSWYYSHRVGREVRELTRHIESLQENKLDVKVGNSHITEIEQTLRVLEQLKTELAVSLEQQWRMEEQKRECILALGHDMKTPIAILKGNSELLAETELDELQRIYNERNLYNINRMQQYTEAIIQVFKSENTGEVVRKSQDFDTFFQELIKNYKLLAEQSGRQLELFVHPCGEYAFDAVMLERAINNIVMNAIEYTPAGKTIRIMLKRTEEIHIVVEDSGTGFTESLLEHATEAFVRGDKSRSKEEDKLHIGLGLYQARQVIEAHGGKLVLSNSDALGGAKIEIILSE